MSYRLPHPIPYQGSKRNLAPLIGQYIPNSVETWYEPFAGSAAMTIWAAHKKAARRYVIGESSAPIAKLWQTIVNDPAEVADTYEQIWNGQDPDDPGYFNCVRKRYNKDRNPVDLLYLICRCVKNAIRFNARGHFTQSVDKRRLGMHPAKMRVALMGVSNLLRGQVEVRASDWLDTLRDVTEHDFIYMDPPYMGTSIGRDKRYAEQMMRSRLIGGLRSLRKRDVRFALSYDGMTGTKEYGPPLPNDLDLTRLFLHAGMSSQATLNGQKAETIESLYLSPGLGEVESSVIRPCERVQGRLAF